MTKQERCGKINTVAKRDWRCKPWICGFSSSGRAPPCQGGGSEFEPRKPLHFSRKFSSAGRASALQAEGQRFEPVNFHHRGPVVQLVRTLACHARGREFEPHPGRQFASVAQLVEQGTENPRVIGSIPIGGTIHAALAHLVERHLAKVEVASSSLVSRSKKQNRLSPRFLSGAVAKW